MATSPVNAHAAARTFAHLLPYIIRGVQLAPRTARDLTQRQFAVLAAIHADGRCRMGLIARNLGVSMPTATGLINRLARAGYVRRVASPADRRQVMVELTAKGQGRVRQLQEAVQRRWSDVLRSLAPRELEAFHHVVTKLHQQLQLTR